MASLNDLKPPSLTEQPHGWWVGTTFFSDADLTELQSLFQSNPQSFVKSEVRENTLLQKALACQFVGSLALQPNDEVDISLSNLAVQVLAELSG